MRNVWQVFVFFGVAAGVILPTQRAAGQAGFDRTRFQWPDTAVDVGSYTTVDECLAATRRISHAISGRGWLAVWLDTVPVRPSDRLLPLPTQVTDAARRCATRFAARTAPLDDLSLLMELYLEASRDADAAALLARRLEQLGPKQLPERDAVMDTAVGIYLDAQPRRLEAAESILTRWPITDRILRLREYLLVAAAASDAGDTTRARSFVLKTLALAASLTANERQSEAFTKMHGTTMIYFVMLLAVSDDHAVLDSLRHSTAAYARVMNRMWPKDLGPPPDVLSMIGEKAAPIVADFWVPAAAAAQQRPTPGHVSLITFIDHGDCLDGSKSGMMENGTQAVPAHCFVLAATLHWLARNFPTLDITTVTHTQGYFAYVLQPPAADEAALIKREMAAFNLPGALAITSAPFSRVPDPDDRRVNRPDPNAVNFSFGTKPKEMDGAMFLVDQNGIVVYEASSLAAGFGGFKLHRLIDVLVQRGSDRVADGHR